MLATTFMQVADDPRLALQVGNAVVDTDEMWPRDRQDDRDHERRADCHCRLDAKLPPGEPGHLKPFPSVVGRVPHRLPDPCRQGQDLPS